MEQEIVRARVVQAALLAGAIAFTGFRAEAQGAPTPDVAPRPRSSRVYVQTEAPPLPERAAAPDGWLGIHYVCEIETWAKNRELFVKHNGYPLVASVEPGSPADRAGIEAGDTIIAYNNEDINGRVLSLTRLLKPGSKLNVRIHRLRETFDIPVVVARRTMYAPDVGAIAPNVRVQIDSVTGLVSLRRANAAARALPQYVVVDPVTPRPALAPLPPVTATAVVTWSTTTALAGAEMARVTPDLGESFGVEQGVLVLSVGANTPAARAGLRGGDVITRVDGTAVSTPSQFKRALQGADGGVKLTLVRKRKEMTVPLRW